MSVRPSPGQACAEARTDHRLGIHRRQELVGKGAYGGVYKGLHVPSGRVVALKVIDLDDQHDDIQSIQSEVALLSTLNPATSSSNNITQYYGSYLLDTQLIIIMDFASGGSIRTLVSLRLRSSSVTVSALTTQSLPCCSDEVRSNRRKVCIVDHYPSLDRLDLSALRQHHS